MRKLSEQRPISAVILTLDLEQRVDQKGWHYDVIVDGPGRDLTMVQSRTWHSRGQLEKEQVDNLLKYVEVQVYQCLRRWGSVVKDPGE